MQTVRLDVAKRTFGAVALSAIISVACATPRDQGPMKRETVGSIESAQSIASAFVPSPSAVCAGTTGALACAASGSCETLIIAFRLFVLQTFLSTAFGLGASRTGPAV
jgi:hypothetical protein